MLDHRALVVVFLSASALVACAAAGPPAASSPDTESRASSGAYAQLRTQTAPPARADAQRARDLPVRPQSFPDTHRLRGKTRT
jgi:hypothetical protein